jgi:hypothetical protein
MLSRFIILILICLGLKPAFCQKQNAKCTCPVPKPGKGTFYFLFGYNLDWFSKSDIHFKDTETSNYDFTLYDVEAVDRPGLKNMLHSNITIPQYSFRLGYYFKNRCDLGIEINYDHVKYVAVDNQPVHLKGTIEGVFYDKDTIMQPAFVRYENTNGANYCIVNLVKRITLLCTKNRKHYLSTVLKAGGGFVFPRTSSTILGRHRNDTYHVAGYVLGADAGLRYDFFRNFCFETSLKGAFANYTDVLLAGKGRANQHFFSLEYIFTLGIQFPL